MRKFLVISLGLASIFALAAVAFAKPRDCQAEQKQCWRNAGVDKNKTFDCEQKYLSCKESANASPFQPGRSSTPGKPSRETGDTRHCPDNTCPPSGGGGGGSKPKKVNGQSQKTADGGTVMVTPEGKEWIWNGKYTSFVRVSRPGYVETITVMQGDPDVSIYKTVDGKTYNVADPKYAQAIAAKQEREKNVVVRDHRNDKPPSTGGGTANGGSPSGGGTSGGATHGAALGSAPSTTTPGNAGVSTTANTGTVVRDHRPGGANGVSAIPPSLAASGINKKPAKNAQ